MKLLTFFSLALLSAAGVSADIYKISAQYPVGGVGTYDYIRYDASTHRLFVTHQTKVAVLDSETGKVLGQIGGLHGVHGVLIAHDLNKGFITNGLDGTVTVFDPKTLAISGSIKTGGEKPDGIEYEPKHHLLIVSNGHSNNESVIDAGSGQVLALIPLAGNPESIGFDGQGHVLVNEESHNSVAQIDLATNKVVNDWSIAPGDGPTGIAIDRKAHRAFVTCGGNAKMVIISTETGAQLAVLPIGDDSDAVVFDPATKRAFSSNRDGTLSVVQEDDADHFHVLETVKTAPVAKTLALDPAGPRLFLPVAQFGPGKDEDHPGPVIPDTFRILVVQ